MTRLAALRATSLVLVVLGLVGCSPDATEWETAYRDRLDTYYEDTAQTIHLQKVKQECGW